MANAYTCNQIKEKKQQNTHQETRNMNKEHIPKKNNLFSQVVICIELFVYKFHYWFIVFKLLLYYS